MGSNVLKKNIHTNPLSITFFIGTEDSPPWLRTSVGPLRPPGALLGLPGPHGNWCRKFLVDAAAHRGNTMHQIRGVFTWTEGEWMFVQGECIVFER